MIYYKQKKPSNNQKAFSFKWIFAHATHLISIQLSLESRGFERLFRKISTSVTVKCALFFLGLKKEIWIRFYTSPFGLTFCRQTPCLICQSKLLTFCRQTPCLICQSKLIISKVLISGLVPCNLTPTCIILYVCFLKRFQKKYFF